uniref:Uncharacterized protein n=1 Tax=Phragmatopoma lapidosa TaxID=341668 RepID=A0A0A0R232_9ANNE|nr:hypothetical protein [Phragmatopoma lapidosa]
MKDHKDDTIVLDGIEIPLESVFAKYLDPISKAVEKSYQIAKKLQKKIDGNIEWDLPNADDISHLISSAEAYIKAFEDLRKFVADNVTKVPDLKTVPLTKEMLDDLTSQLETVKKMPFY